MLSGWDLANTILSILGSIAIVGQVLFWIIKPSLPRARQCVLEDTLKETESLFYQCIEEGRIRNATDIAAFNKDLAYFRDRAGTLRVETMGAKTFVDHVRNLRNGPLSRRLKRLYKQVRSVQAGISRSSTAALPDVKQMQITQRASEAAAPGCSDATSTTTLDSSPMLSSASSEASSGLKKAGPGSFSGPAPSSSPNAPSDPCFTSPPEPLSNISPPSTSSSSCMEGSSLSSYYRTKPLLGRKEAKSGHIASSLKTSPMHVSRRRKLRAFLSRERALVRCARRSAV